MRRDPAAIGAPDSAAEVERLRRILEMQPACLVRLTLGGTFLAANDAALGLFGTSDLAAVVDHDVERHLGLDRAEWEAFAARTWSQGSGSLECRVANGERTAMISAVPLRDHPDGLESLIVTLRETSAARALEASLETAVATNTLETSSASSAVEQERLASELKKANEEVVYLQQLADQQQRLLTERDRRRAETEAELADTVAAHQRLVAALDEADSTRRGFEQAAAALEAQLAEERAAREAALREQERAAGDLTSLHSQLAQAVADRARTDDLLASAGRARELLEAEIAHVRDEIARRDERESALLNDLRGDLASARAEVSRLTVSGAKRDAELALTAAELEETRAALRAARDDHRLAELTSRLADLSARLAATESDRRALMKALDEANADRDRDALQFAAESEHLAARSAALEQERDDLAARHERACAELDEMRQSHAREAEASETEHRDAVAALQAQLAAAIAGLKRAKTAAALAEEAADRRAEADATRQTQLTEQLARTVAANRTLATAVVELRGELKRVQAIAQALESIQNEVTHVVSLARTFNIPSAGADDVPAESKP